MVPETSTDGRTLPFFLMCTHSFSLASVKEKIFTWLGAVLLLSLSATAPALAQQQPPSAETAFQEAFTLYSNRLFDQASQAFRGFRTTYPNHPSIPEALYYEADAHFSLGEEMLAIALLNDFQEAFPSHPLAFEARLALGTYYYEEGAYDEALTLLEQVATNAPTPELAAQAIYLMGEAYRNLGRDAEALAQFERVSNQYMFTPSAPIAVYALAGLHLRASRFDEAAAAFEVLTTRYTQSPYARNVGLALAEVYYELEDYRRAVVEINERLPNLEGEARDRAIFILAESYNQLRDSENAIVQYRRFTEGNPDSPYYRRALYGLAWNYHFEGAYQWAAEHFGQARGDVNDDLAAEATYYQAVNLKIAQQPQAAIPLFSEVAINWPNHDLADNAQFELAVTHYERNNWRASNAAFTRLIQTYPNSDLLGEALRLEGNTFIALNNFDAALNSFDRAIALDAAPEDLIKEVEFQKAWLLYLDGRYNQSGPTFLAMYQADPNASQAGDALFWAAESFYQTGELQQAARLFRDYQRDFPTGTHATATHYALGWVYFKNSNYEQAIASFNAFLRDYQENNALVPYRTDARMRLADSYYALKRYPEAIRVYRQLADDGEDYALYQTGQAFYNAGEPFEAITAFQKLLADYPGSDWREEAEYQLGYIYMQNQDFENAINVYNTLITRYPNDPIAAKAQYGIGDALYNAGRYGESVTAYKRVLDSYANSPFVADAATGMQNALIILDDEDRMTAIIDSFATANPNSTLVDELRFRQAEVKYQSGALDEAQLGFQRFVRASQNAELLPEAYYYLGAIFDEKDQVREAETYFRQIIDQYPSSTRTLTAYQTLGRIYLEGERFQSALSTYEGMQAYRPNDPAVVAAALYGQSRALQALGRTGRAESLLQAAVDAAPDAAATLPAYLGLARIFEADGREELALRYYQDVANRDRTDVGAEALYRLGRLYLQLDSPQQAIEELSRMSVLFGGFPDWVAQGLLAEADAFLMLGQRGDAKRVYERIEEEFFGTAYAETATRAKAEL